MSEKLLFVLVRRPPSTGGLLPTHRSYGPFCHDLDALIFANRARTLYSDAIVIIETLRPPESL